MVVGFLEVAVGTIGQNQPASCCTKFLLLHILLHIFLPNPPKTPQNDVVLCRLTAAYAEFAEKDKGSLEPGKFADLAVLSQDIFSVPPPELPKTESVLTVVGGKTVYDAKALSVQ
jgi:cytosine/adenosine deaminase-related metal-dependent hydrolase